MDDSTESTDSATIPITQGCGTISEITIQISPTTGGDFTLNVEPNITVENLKKLVSKKLKLSRDRICLLFRNKQLQEGVISQHGVSNGSKVTLLPNVEAGLITQRPEVGIMQALESLNDTQVNEFLCGKAPLNLSMRLGDHMMLIQLQLSTVMGVRPQSSAGGSQSSSRPPSLVQASRNLQHTLRRLSADVFSGRDEGRRGSVYSGTFSGALNPALQDPKGRPRRDVATIVHILNDLLCSAPELRRVNRRTVDDASSAMETGQEDNFSGSLADATPTSEISDSLGSLLPGPSRQSGVLEGGPGGEPPCKDDQDLRTRGKLEHLRLVMGERRAKRRQRKQKPYSLPSADADTVTA